MADDETEFPPLLPEGFHNWTLADIRSRCVDAQPLSTSRSSLCEALESVVTRLRAVDVVGQIWLDGSFVTEKINPSDIDFIAVILAADYDRFSAEAQEVVDGLVDGERWKPPTCCDTNVAFIEPPERSNSLDVLEHWRRWLGYSTHTQTPKGIVVITLGAEEILR